MDAIDKINIRLKKILEYLKYLKEYQGIDSEILKNDYEKRAIVERYFQLAGVLPKKFAKSFSDIAGFRNFLVNDYLKIDYRKVADNLNNKLSDFEKFARDVAKYLS